MPSDPSKYLDPRWQKKRLEILERDGWKCRWCEEAGNTLHVHHKYYLDNTDLWDYPGDAFITLCACCHNIESRQTVVADKRLLLEAKKRFCSDERWYIAKALGLSLPDGDPETRQYGDSLQEQISFLCRSSSARALIKSRINQVLIDHDIEEAGFCALDPSV